jgi:hypothetical protein
MCTWDVDVVKMCALRNGLYTDASVVLRRNKKFKRGPELIEYITISHLIQMIARKHILFFSFGVSITARSCTSCSWLAPSKHVARQTLLALPFPALHVKHHSCKGVASPR